MTPVLHSDIGLNAGEYDVVGAKYDLLATYRVRERVAHHRIGMRLLFRANRVTLIRADNFITPMRNVTTQCLPLLFDTDTSSRVVKFLQGAVKFSRYNFFA